MAYDDPVKYKESGDFHGLAGACSSCVLTLNIGQEVKGYIWMVHGCDYLCALHGIIRASI